MKLSALENAPRVAIDAERLPMRHASLPFRPKTSQLMSLTEAEEPEQQTSPVPPPPPEPESPPLPKSRLAKEKTRSRVWSALTGKRISKAKAVPPCETHPANSLTPSASNSAFGP
jgi:hypothetical protein